MSERSAVRAADSDRDQVVELLNSAFSEGRISAEEHDQRTTAALAAKTLPELKPLTEDLSSPSPAETKPRPPRAPQDHQPKKAKKPKQKPPTDQARTITFEGFDYLIEPARMNDLTFMEYLSEMETKPFFVAKVIHHILGDEQWNSFRTNHADEQGLTSVDKAGDLFSAIDADMKLGN